jgi:5-methylcytosine-specific restriction endonuclease McrA
MFNYLKNIPEIDWKENKGMEKFMEETKSFKKKYKIDQRKITLTEKDKLKLIQIQNNESSISGTPIFLGDDIEVDHEFPISKGGKDVIENLRVVHKDENREKGSKV